MSFSPQPTATIRAKTSNGEYISINGVTNADTTKANAVSQINKILSIVGKSITGTNVTRIKLEIGVDN